MHHSRRYAKGSRQRRSGRIGIFRKPSQQSPAEQRRVAGEMPSTRRMFVGTGGKQAQSQITVGPLAGDVVVEIRAQYLVSQIKFGGQRQQQYVHIEVIQSETTRQFRQGRRT